MVSSISHKINNVPKELIEACSEIFPWLLLTYFCINAASSFGWRIKELLNWDMVNIAMLIFGVLCLFSVAARKYLLVWLRATNILLVVGIFCILMSPLALLFSFQAVAETFLRLGVGLLALVMLTKVILYC